MAEVKEMKSEINSHFGSARAFIIIEKDEEAVTAFYNVYQQHSHEACCDPLKTLDNYQADAIKAPFIHVKGKTEEGGYHVEGKEEDSDLGVQEH